MIQYNLKAVGVRATGPYMHAYIGKSSAGSTDGCFHGALVASWCPGDPLHQGVQFEGVVQKGPHLGG